jgi:hypothetical protein
MCTHVNVYFLIFSYKDFYKRDVKDMIYAESVYPNLSHWIIGVFSQHIENGTFIFPIGFLKDNIREHSSYFSHGVFGVV